MLWTERSEPGAPQEKDALMPGIKSESMLQHFEGRLIRVCQAEQGRKLCIGT